jgi:hypothetical protein
VSIQLLVGASVGIVVVSILCNQSSGESYEKLHESFVEVKVLNMCSNFLQCNLRKYQTYIC